MFAGGGVQTGIFEAQALDRAIAEDVGVNDFVDVGESDSSVPDRLRINHEIGPVLALIETAGLVGAHPSLQTTLREFLLESLLQFRTTGGIAGAARVLGRANVAADKNVALELGHKEIVAAVGAVVSGQWLVVSGRRSLVDGQKGNPPRSVSAPFTNSAFKGTRRRR